MMISAAILLFPAFLVTAYAGLGNLTCLNGPFIVTKPSIVNDFLIIRFREEINQLLQHKILRLNEDMRSYAAYSILVVNARAPDVKCCKSLVLNRATDYSRSNYVCRLRAECFNSTTDVVPRTIRFLLKRSWKRSQVKEITHDVCWGPEEESTLTLPSNLKLWKCTNGSCSKRYIFETKCGTQPLIYKPYQQGGFVAVEFITERVAEKMAQYENITLQALGTNIEPCCSPIDIPKEVFNSGKHVYTCQIQPECDLSASWKSVTFYIKTPDNDMEKLCWEGEKEYDGTVRISDEDIPDCPNSDSIQTSRETVGNFSKGVAESVYATRVDYQLGIDIINPRDKHLGDSVTVIDSKDNTICEKSGISGISQVSFNCIGSKIHVSPPLRVLYKPSRVVYTVTRYKILYPPSSDTRCYKGFVRQEYNNASTMMDEATTTSNDVTIDETGTGTDTSLNEMTVSDGVTPAMIKENATGAETVSNETAEITERLSDIPTTAENEMRASTTKRLPILRGQTRDPAEEEAMGKMSTSSGATDKNVYFERDNGEILGARKDLQEETGETIPLRSSTTMSLLPMEENEKEDDGEHYFPLCNWGWSQSSYFYDCPPENPYYKPIPTNGGAQRRYFGSFLFVASVFILQ